MLPRAFLVILLLIVFAQIAPAQYKRIVIAASTLLDGKGHVLHNTRIVIEGSKIVAIDPKARGGRLRGRPVRAPSA